MIRLRIFDLDGTVICSEHRKISKPDGTLDLEHWIENSTPTKVALDSILPLAEIMRKAYREGDLVIVCTSRVLGDADFEFFMENDIPYHTMLSRPAGCTVGDADYKEFQLRLYAHNQGMSWAKFCALSIFFEDAKPVLDRMDQIGVANIDAQKWNKRAIA